MWDNSKSLLLSRYWMKLAYGIWFVSPIFCLYLLRHDIIAVAIYSGCYLPILFIFRYMSNFLENIAKGEIFIPDNVKYLRLVSWACFWAAVFLLFGALAVPILILLSCVIGFFGLLMRVIKNMLFEANLLKEENDYTI